MLSFKEKMLERKRLSQKSEADKSQKKSDITGSQTEVTDKGKPSANNMPEIPEEKKEEAAGPKDIDENAFANALS